MRLEESCIGGELQVPRSARSGAALEDGEQKPGDLERAVGLVERRGAH